MHASLPSVLNLYVKWRSVSVKSTKPQSHPFISQTSSPPAEKSRPHCCCLVTESKSFWLFVTPRTAARQAFLSFTTCLSFLKLIRTSYCCRKGDPFRGPRVGSCITLRNAFSKETMCKWLDCEGAPGQKAVGWGPRGAAVPWVPRSVVASGFVPLPRTQWWRLCLAGAGGPRQGLPHIVTPASTFISLQWKGGWGGEESFLFFFPWTSLVPVLSQLLTLCICKSAFLPLNLQDLHFTPICLCSCCCCQVAAGVSDSGRPRRRQPTRLPWPWDSPGKSTGGGCHLLLQGMKVKSLNHCQLLATSWTAAYQAPLSMGFSRQGYWSGCHCLLLFAFGSVLNGLPWWLSW